MRIVIDTNVFVSAFFWGGHPEEVFERVINGLDELLITEEIIKEIMSVMSSSKFTVNINDTDNNMLVT